MFLTFPLLIRMFSIKLFNTKLRMGPVFHSPLVLVQNNSSHSQTIFLMTLSILDIHRIGGGREGGMDGGMDRREG